MCRDKHILPSWSHRVKSLCRTPVVKGGLAMKPLYPFPAPPGYRWVFTPYFRHYRTGQLVYRKDGKCFCFLVKD